jgi:hypothetical protein
VGKNNFLIPLAYTIGIALPFILVYFLPIYHVTDTFLFSRWGDYLAAGKVYIDCLPKVPYYPSMGTLTNDGKKTEAIYSLEVLPPKLIWEHPNYAISIKTTFAMSLEIYLWTEMNVSFDFIDKSGQRGEKLARARLTL